MLKDGSDMGGKMKLSAGDLVALVSAGLLLTGLSWTAVFLAHIPFGVTIAESSFAELATVVALAGLLFAGVLGYAIVVPGFIYRMITASAVRDNPYYQSAYRWIFPAIGLSGALWGVVLISPKATANLAWLFPALPLVVTALVLDYDLRPPALSGPVPNKRAARAVAFAALAAWGFFWLGPLIIIALFSSEPEVSRVLSAPQAFVLLCVTAGIANGITARSGNVIETIVAGCMCLVLLAIFSPREIASIPFRLLNVADYKTTLYVDAETAARITAEKCDRRLLAPDKHVAQMFTVNVLSDVGSSYVVECRENTSPKAAPRDVLAIPKSEHVWPVGDQRPLRWGT